MQLATYDRMQVAIYDSESKVGAAAADDLAQILAAALAERESAAIILATGNSQLAFMKALRAHSGIDWQRIAIFHMDEYPGLSAEHPASFRRYIREKLTDVVQPRAFYGIEADAPDLEAEMVRYTRLLDKEEPVACVLGIGENCHLAFNDPPVDFDTSEVLKVVKLAEESRRQQVNEGHFEALEDTPRLAVTLTVPALLRPPHVLAVVPERRKAPAVRASLEGPFSRYCPASILRTQSHVKMYLDRDSASLLTGVRIETGEQTSTEA
jgi:glucosamine-6-phosphate deaminase